MRSTTNIAILAALPPLMLAVSVLSSNAATAQDRYGPSRPADPADMAPVAILTWPGKAAPATATKPASVVAAAAAPALPASIYAPSQTNYRPTYQAAYRPAPAAVPAQAAAPATPAVATSGAQPMLIGGQGDAPRFYSLHRQFGLQPDPIAPSPIALSPQFLADTSVADLAEPPPPPPPHVNPAQTANMSTAAAASQARAAQAESQSADTVN